MMDEKMLQSFHLWMRSKETVIAGTDIVEWTLDYLRTQQEPDCFAVLTSNGSRLVSPEEAKGRVQAYPLFTNPVPPSVPEGWQLVPKSATDAMAVAAIKAHFAYPDQINGLNYWRAMLAAAPKQGEE